MCKKQKKRKGGKPFTLRERSVIEVRWCRDGKKIVEIAKELKRNKSSISREIGGKPRKGRGRYNADAAHEKAIARIAHRGNIPKTARNQTLKAYLETKMVDERWSPEQVSIRLPIEFPEDPAMRIAPETVYQEVYRRVHRGGNGAVKRGEFDLRPYLPRRHTRRATKGFRKAQKMERDASLPSIETRPAIVEKRRRIGDWEDDTLVSRASASRIKNATERMSGITLFGKTRDGTAESCDAVLVRKLSRLPVNVRKTLTRDRGTENLRWREVEQALTLKTFFAHPYCSHERGTNENTNGLIRRFFPKKTDWGLVSDDDLARVEYLLNTRPRKRHGGLTPLEVFFRETGVAIYS
jgi:IS30 family transposase